jgi:PAS domain S-box-containing protein
VKGKWSGEVINIKKNKEKFPCILSAFIIKDEKGNPKGAMGILRDITERKQAEESLKTSEERFRIIFEYAPDAYYLNDLRGDFIDGNIAAEKLTGYKRDELVGKSFLKLKLLPAGQIPRAASLLARNAIGHSTGPDEFKLLRRGGTEVPVEIRTYPVEIEGKKIVLGIAHDITARKRLEEESNRRSEDLAKSNEELKRKAEEFERLNRLTVGRELKMIELKKRIAELEEGLKRGGGTSDSET